MFENSDLKDFWNSHEYYTENYVEEPLTDEIIAFYENKLGLKFQSYIQLMKTQMAVIQRNLIGLMNMLN